MRFLQRIRRKLRLSRLVRKYDVWTKDSGGRVFHYDIRVCPTSHGNRFLVRFSRYSVSTGNTFQWLRTLSHAEVRNLELQAAS